MRKNLFLSGTSLAAAVGLLALPFVATADPGNGTSNGPLDPITICHATASATNPFVQITVDENSIVNDSGHGNSGVNVGDIIPPFTFGAQTYLGNNWDATGQAIWNNGCNVPAAGGGGGSSTSTSMVSGTLSGIVITATSTATSSESTTDTLSGTVIATSSTSTVSGGGTLSGTVTSTSSNTLSGTVATSSGNILSGTVDSSSSGGGGGGGGTNTNTNSNGGGGGGGGGNGPPVGIGGGGGGPAGQVLGASTSSPQQFGEGGFTPVLPGIPNTGEGGEAMPNIITLSMSALLAIAAALFLARRYQMMR